MLTYPQIDPIAISLGPLAVRWYGLMWALSFVGVWWLGRRYARRPGAVVCAQGMDDLLFFGALGAMIGGRLGYMLFYQSADFLAAPWTVLRIWEGGMSFHGGLLGVIVAAWLFARRRGIGFLALMDFAALLAPIGLGLGRIGNFINGELWGKVTDLPWGMVYPPLGPRPRHPSSLYEFLLEGVVLFVLLNLYARKPRPVGAISGLFLIAYGAFRFLVELVRLPDAHLGYRAWDWLTTGQILTLPMLLLGAVLLFFALRPARRPRPA